MKRKLSQRLTRAARQIARHGATPIRLTNFPGRVIWEGTAAELHAAPIVCGMPEPLLMSPTSKDPSDIVQAAIRRAR